MDHSLYDDLDFSPPNNLPQESKLATYMVQAEERREGREDPWPTPLVYNRCTRRRGKRGGEVGYSHPSNNSHPP
ncbi:jg1898 [Pararge aegeria aegeria]|uniref:Jg1898 protein n=1 Tax=Pararge aegeria aegeria TaxID=348720 RepID=A0A8S4QV98_9NEOP|nr:jg1898 [Pararge aegeria aegeria]